MRGSGPPLPRVFDVAARCLLGWQSGKQWTSHCDKRQLTIPQTAIVCSTHTHTLWMTSTHTMHCYTTYRYYVVHRAAKEAEKAAEAAAKAARLEVGMVSIMVWD